ncbi:prepilin-type N-terminal cleavage/methylation domain-containing protein [Pendulispora albinea]|uniref:Type II secretion system GspH family protein n=1 Tax=Pendulispora albinea TaxID=2741071 RepID=A0ABZ2LKU9_9BACT
MRRVLRNGFTLVKMLVVVAMVGLLAGLALYGVRASRRTFPDMPGSHSR